jgi:hypothetical protein
MTFVMITFFVLHIQVMMIKIDFSINEFPKKANEESQT